MSADVPPGTGRILDYWYGGTHHTPADRGAAEAFQQIYPHIPHVFLTLRSYKGWMARYIEAQGIDQFIVFGAGIPSHGNVHEVVRNAQVLYTDIDPLCVSYGQEILADVPNAAYAFCDVTDLSTLDQAVAERWLDMSKPVGVILVGVTVFLTDAQVQECFAALDAWLPAGSYCGLDFDGEGWSHFPAILAAIASTGSPLHMRNPALIEPLIAHWELVGQGIVPASATRRGLPNDQNEDAVFMYGAVVRT
jgi:O-methyltransferase involved in polyketide biosynthesis